MKGKSRPRAKRVLQCCTGAWGQPKEPSGRGGVCHWSTGVGALLVCPSPSPSSCTPGCCCFCLSPCCLISAHQQLCVHPLLSSIPSNHFHASSTVRSWAEGNFFFSPQNPALIYSICFCVNHKRKKKFWNQCLNMNQNSICGGQGVFIAILFVFWDKNSLFMKNAVVTGIPLFPLQHIH